MDFNPTCIIHFSLLALANLFDIRRKVFISCSNPSDISLENNWMALSSSAGQIIIMEGLQKWAFIRNMLGCFICIGLNYILIPKYGTIGAAYVTIITLIFSGCLANILIPPYYNVLRFNSIQLFWLEIFVSTKF